MITIPFLIGQTYSNDQIANHYLEIRNLIIKNNYKKVVIDDVCYESQSELSNASILVSFCGKVWDDPENFIQYLYSVSPPRGKGEHQVRFYGMEKSNQVSKIEKDSWDTVIFRFLETSRLKNKVFKL